MILVTHHVSPSSPCGCGGGSFSESFRHFAIGISPPYALPLSLGFQTSPSRILFLTFISGAGTIGKRMEWVEHHIRTVYSTWKISNRSCQDLRACLHGCMSYRFLSFPSTLGVPRCVHRILENQREGEGISLSNPHVLCPDNIIYKMALSYVFGLAW